ncbi:hypothetical protein LTR27_010573 [Elasticomyces elasticus]|nr:hypothetical protein LTR27_010573 [Elasticomyces elasticus]
MPPKGSKAKATTKSTTKAAAPLHASYLDMIKEAVINLKERTGSSRQALQKYVQANNNLNITDARFRALFNAALARGSESGVFARPKGSSGPVKLAGPTKAGSPAAPKPAATKKAPAKAKATPTKKAPAKKIVAKKTTTAKAPAAKKTVAKKAAPAKKATATKSKATTTKANTGKARKTPVIAPAVSTAPSVVLGKTKSGRVTKSAQPQAAATAAKKKAAPKSRKAPAKRVSATPKKTTTPRSKA